MGVPRTLAKGLSKLKEAAELRKLGGTQAERMARAASQGYGIDFLHGSPTLKETDAISLTHPKRTDAGYLGNAVYGSRPEDEFIARAYAGRNGEVHRLKTRASNFKDFVYDENYRQNIGDFGESIGVKADRNSPEWAQEFADRMQASGYEGARGLADDGTVVEYAIYNPAQVRSVNADFNPEYRDSPNLLASVAGAMPYAGATAALLAGATGSQEAEAGALQSLGRAAPYLTSAALGGAAALQSGDAEASFIGTLAKTFPHDMLGMARKMKDYGLSRAEIWRKTGIDLDNVDGLPRSELPDNPQGISSMGAGALRDYAWRKQNSINDQPDLYRAYPDLAEIPTGNYNLDGYKGMYDPVKDEIVLAPQVLNAARKNTKAGRAALDDVNSINAHELMHGIQQREGFAKGGNMEDVASIPDQYQANDLAELDQLLNKYKLPPVGEGNPVYAAIDLINRQPALDDYDKISELEQRFRLAQSPHQKYLNLAGEAEARNVQTRLNMTAAERRATPPWETLDVPESEQIVRMRGNATPALLGATAAGTGAGMAAADAFSAQPDPSYDAYIRDAMEARTAAESFAQMRGSKAGYWEARRQELLEMVNGLGEMANNVVLPALDKPLQGYLGLAGTAGALAQGQGLQQALMQGANIARQPSDQTTYNMGGAVTDTLSPYTTPEAAAAAGALTNAGIQMLSPI